jgi:hypothetical protein
MIILQPRFPYNSGQRGTGNPMLVRRLATILPGNANILPVAPVSKQEKPGFPCEVALLEPYYPVDPPSRVPSSAVHNNDGQYGAPSLGKEPPSCTR